MILTPVETTGPAPAVVVAKLSKVKPGCDVSATATSGSSTATASGTADANGKAALTLNLSTAYKIIYVTATTVNCDFSEDAEASLNPLLEKVKLPACVAPNQKFTAQGIRFPANTSITFEAKLGSKTVTVSGTTDSKGTAKVTMKLPKKGTWVVTATAGGRHASSKIIVL